MGFVWFWGVRDLTNLKTKLHFLFDCDGKFMLFKKIRKFGFQWAPFDEIKDHFNF